jgi:trigger factor
MAPDDDTIDANEEALAAADDPEAIDDDAELGDDTAAGDEEEKPSLSLDVQVETPSACVRHVTVTIPREDIERYYNEAYSELMPSAEVPGFRPGRAPRKLVEARYRKQVREQIKGSLLMDSMTQVSDDQDFTPIGEPDFDLDAIEVPDDGPMTFEFDIEVRPEFDLPQWRGLRLERPVRDVTAEDVKERLSDSLARYGQIVPFDGPAEADDYLTVNITFTAGDDQISRVEEQMVRVRPVLSFHDGRLEGFDKLMDGAREGDVRKATFQLSQEISREDLRGADVDAEFEVLDVKRLQLPAFDRAFLDRIGGFEDEGELRDFVRGELERQLGYHQMRRIREQITEQLTKTANWELPQDLLKRQSQRELQRAVLELQSAGFSDEEIRAHENALRQNSMANTATALKEHFILERIAEDEEIEDDPADYDREIELIAMQSGDSPRRVRARLDKKGQMDALRNQIIERKVIERIMAEATFDDVDFELDTHETYAVDFTVSGHDDSSIPEAKPGGEAAELPDTADRR